MNRSQVLGHFDMNIRLREHLSKGNYGKAIISNNRDDQYNYIGNYIYLLWIDDKGFYVSYEDVDVNGILEIVDDYCDG